MGCPRNVQLGSGITPLPPVASAWRVDPKTGYVRVAGLGPYRHVPSIAILEAHHGGHQWSTPPFPKDGKALVLASWLVDSHTITDLRRIQGPTEEATRFATYLNINMVDFTSEAPGRIRRYERYWAEVEVATDGRVVTVGLIPVDRPEPRRVRFKSIGAVSGEGLIDSIQNQARVMSYANAHVLKYRLEQSDSLLEQAGTCTHPQIRSAKCVVCGEPYPRNAHKESQELTPRDVLHRGVLHTYQWDEDDQKRVVNHWGKPTIPEGSGTGLEFLNQRLQIQRAVPEVEPTIEPEPKSWPDVEKPLVGGYFGAYGVILFEEEAKRLAAMYDLIQSNPTYAELLGTADVFGYEWVREVVDQWQEDRCVDTGDEPPPIDPRAVVDVPMHYWDAEEEYGTQWPWIDSDTYTLGPYLDIAQYLGDDVESIGIDFEFGVRIENLDAVVAALVEAGAPIRIDKELIKKAGGYNG
jgi:hypothetical protein